MTKNTSETESSAEAADYPGLGTASYTLSLLFVAYIFSFMDRQILALLVGPIRDEFGITDFEYSLLQGAAFSLLYTIAGIPLGRIADRYSRRLLAAGSVVFWSIATMACGLSQNFTQLFIGRMGVGTGEAGLTPSAYSLILDSFRPAHVGYAMSIYKVAIHIGGGLSLVIGGFLYDFYDSLDAIIIPVIGDIAPWQATIISVGAPGLFLGLLMLTMNEPDRKGAATNADGSVSPSLPMRTILQFTWARRRVYLSLFLGSSLLSMSWYGSAAWYPELLFRNYGLSKSEAGLAYGMITIFGGSTGIMAAAWLGERLKESGFIDANVRTILITTTIAMPLSIFAPLAGSAEMTLLILAPAVFVGSGYMGLMAVAFVIITPNQMRGQMTAMYIFITNIIGMAIGGSLLAAFTDFVFKDDNMLHYSLASVNALFYPMAVLFLWYCLGSYKAAVIEAESGDWSMDPKAPRK